MIPRHLWLVAPLSALLLSSTPSRAAEHFDLYGGPGALEGTFQDALGSPDWQGWTSSDKTFKTNHWHVSDFNAENLNGHGVGNLAMWCGDASPPPPTWADAPGYGNGWYDILQWNSGPLADPSAGQVVDLDFFFNQETEPGYDFFQVQYQVGTDWVTVFAKEGTNKSGGNVFAAPGLQYSLQGGSPIAYAGNDYGGPGGDEIVLRLLFTSDGAFSDADGLFPTTAGGVQVDDIAVNYDDGGPQSDFEDFEGPAPYRWHLEQTPYVGDFAKILIGLTDLDPCLDNLTPQMTFIDDGSSPNNAPGQTTGGSTSPTWHYGTPEGWTTNSSGGLIGPEARVSNIVWSPDIALDLPGVEDDGDHFRYFVEFDTFDHNPDGWTWLYGRLMTTNDGGTTWSDRGNVLFSQSTEPMYSHHEIEMTSRFPIGTTHVRIGFSFGVNSGVQQPFDATPAPFIDNVHLYKEASGPIIEANDYDLFQDAFPANGSLDVSTMTSRDALDAPVAGTYTGWGPNQDAIVVRAKSVTYTLTTPSTTTLHWVLDVNPLFEDAIRTMPAGSSVSVGTGPNGWNQVMGTLTGTLAGVSQQYWYDLPDEDFFYPGDQLRYYIQAQVPGGPVSTLPADLDGFLDGDGYDPLFTVRALPTITDASGTQPPILLIDYASGSEDALLWKLSLQQIGLRLDHDVDLLLWREAGTFLNYVTTLDQVAGYSSVLVSGKVTPGSLDYQFLRNWEQEPGDRLVAYFGDDIVTGASALHRTDVMGVDLLGPSVSASIGGQTAPRVLPQQPGFSTTYVANATCRVRPFDAILPTGTAVMLHAFDDGGGGIHTNVAASVLHERFDGEGDRIIDVTFPYTLDAIESVQSKGPGAFARANLLAEVLALMGHTGGLPTPAPLPERAGIHELVASPNPFNPRTEVRFRLGQAADTRVAVYDVRGRHVLDLHDGPLAAGAHRLPWSGIDTNGAALASGVYFVQVQADGDVRTLKISLLE